ncbi:MAG: hypothetical protein V1672_02625 [Candidatus Diapherotrites archaeon]
MRKWILVVVLLAVIAIVAFVTPPKNVLPEEGGEFEEGYFDNLEPEPLEPEIEQFLLNTDEELTVEHELASSKTHISTLPLETQTALTKITPELACREYADFSDTKNTVICDLYVENISDSYVEFVASMVLKDVARNCVLQCEEPTWDPDTFERSEGYYASVKYARLNPGEIFDIELECTPKEQVPLKVEIRTSPEKISVPNKC